MASCAVAVYFTGMPVLVTGVVEEFHTSVLHFKKNIYVFIICILCASNDLVIRDLGAFFCITVTCRDNFSQL